MRPEIVNQQSLIEPFVETVDRLRHAQIQNDWPIETNSATEKHDMLFKDSTASEF